MQSTCKNNVLLWGKGCTGEENHVSRGEEGFVRGGEGSNRNIPTGKKKGVWKGGRNYRKKPPTHSNGNLYSGGGRFLQHKECI